MNMLYNVENLWKNKKIFYEDLSKEWTIHHMSELIIGMGYFNRHVGRNIDGHQGVDGGFTTGKKIKREGCY